MSPKQNFMDNKEEFYKRLRNTLKETTVFPTQYIYKFIVPSKDGGVEEVINLFKDKNIKVRKKDSKKGTYTSVSISVLMDSPEAIIAKYQQAESIKDIIAL